MRLRHLAYTAALGLAAAGCTAGAQTEGTPQLTLPPVETTTPGTYDGSVVHLEMFAEKIDDPAAPAVGVEKVTSWNLVKLFPKLSAAQLAGCRLQFADAGIVPSEAGAEITVRATTADTTDTPIVFGFTPGVEGASIQVPGNITEIGRRTGQVALAMADLGTETTKDNNGSPLVVGRWGIVLGGNGFDLASVVSFTNSDQIVDADGKPTDPYRSVTVNQIRCEVRD